MIYASSSIIVNTSSEVLWKYLLESSTQFDKACQNIENFQIDEEYDDGLLRSYELDSEHILERAFHIKESLKIVWRLHEHPIYFGETILNILCSKNENLSDKKVTLNAVLIWRIHPGVIATPQIEKQEFLEHLAKNIAEIAEQDSAPLLNLTT